MANTVIGLFDQNDQADQVVRELKSAGFDGDQISEAVRAGGGSRFKEDAALNIPGIGSLGASGPLHRALSGGGGRTPEFISALQSLGVPADDAQYYAEGVRRGGSLVAVVADEARTEPAIDIMCRHGAIDCANRGTQWKQAGWSGFDASATALTDVEINNERTRVSENAQAIPVVQEELRVGKREVERGGVRVWKHVTEIPVEENVNLRQEHVHVERRAVDRPITDADVATAFKDETVELTERSEEAIVTKDARVVEEVVVSKDVEQRTETVRDTVRKTDVDVEQIDTARPGQTTRGTTDKDIDITSTDASRTKTNR